MWVLSWAGIIIGFWAIFKIAGLGIRWAREGFRMLEPSEWRRRKEERIMMKEDDWGDF